MDLRLFIALILWPALATPGVVYDVSIRPVDLSDIALVGANGSPAPVVTRYFVEDGRVRIGGATAKTAYVFKERTMYVIDNTSHAVHILKHATLSQLAEHYADAVKQLQIAAATAAPDERAAAEQKAADMKEVSDRMRQTVPHDYKVTVRFESVDGHACRIWEERENGLKRLELCVAPAASIAGGTDILSGMKTLSQFRQGSNFALGIEFGLADWWPDFTTLGGIPILIREFKYDSEITEIMLSAMHTGVQAAIQFDIPSDYRVEEGPDYTQWYMR